MNGAMQLENGARLEFNGKRVIVVSSDGKRYELDEAGKLIELRDKVIRKSSAVNSNNIFDYIKQGHYVDYTPDIAEVVLDGEYTGALNAQHIKTEENTIWRVLYVDKETDRIVIATQGTVNKVELRGKTGYHKGPKVLHFLCEKGYSNKKLEIKASSMIVEDLNKACDYKLTGNANEYYCYNPGKYNEIVKIILGNEPGWLASSCVVLYADASSMSVDVRYASDTAIDSYCLRNIDGEICSPVLGVRPKVTLSSKLFADVVDKNGIGTSKEKAWRLINS